MEGDGFSQQNRETSPGRAGAVEEGIWKLPVIGSGLVARLRLEREVHHTGHDPKNFQRIRAVVEKYRQETGRPL